MKKLLIAIMLMMMLTLVSCNQQHELKDNTYYDVYVDDELVFTQVNSYLDYKWTDDYFCLKYYYGDYYECYFSDNIEVKKID